VFISLPFIISTVFIPLLPAEEPLEHKFHVAHRPYRCDAGTRMEFATSTPDLIADAMMAALKWWSQFSSVESDGGKCAGRMLVNLIW